jgi:hypothetical protein
MFFNIDQKRRSIAFKRKQETQLFSVISLMKKSQFRVIRHGELYRENKKFYQKRFSILFFIEFHSTKH